MAIRRIPGSIRRFLDSNVSGLLDGSNFVQSGAAVNETPWFCRPGSAYPHRIKRDFQAQSASISAISKGVGEFGEVEGGAKTRSRRGRKGLRTKVREFLRPYLRLRRPIRPNSNNGPPQNCRKLSKVEGLAVGVFVGVSHMLERSPACYESIW